MRKEKYILVLQDNSLPPGQPWRGVVECGDGGSAAHVVGVEFWVRRVVELTPQHLLTLRTAACGGRCGV